jgi:hypothetical protein
MRKSTSEKTFTFVHDYGHGWLSANVTDLRDVGLKPKDITMFSYMRNGTVYLEEDLDMATFVKAYQWKYGYVPKMKAGKLSARSYVRSYVPFHWGSPETW